ncbi:hypothetical protein QM312_36285, partial [Burkholderia cenocepacia]|nr:hypothetical protein [Burkholderia cenocepacia]
MTDTLFARADIDALLAGRHPDPFACLGPHDDPVILFVRAEARERVGMAAGEQRVDVGAREQRVGHGFPPSSGSTPSPSRRSTSAASPPTG